VFVNSYKCLISYNTETATKGLKIRLFFIVFRICHYFRNKNWGEADSIRDSLKQHGVILEDLPGNKTSWRRE
jgi:cysteinyl-tRNA synthetase